MHYCDSSILFTRSSFLPVAFRPRPFKISCSADQALSHNCCSLVCVDLANTIAQAAT